MLPRVICGGTSLVRLLTKILKGGAPLDPSIFDDPKVAYSPHSSTAFKADQIVDVSRRTHAKK